MDEFGDESDDLTASREQVALATPERPTGSKVRPVRPAPVRSSDHANQHAGGPEVLRHRALHDMHLWRRRPRPGGVKMGDACRLCATLILTSGRYERVPRVSEATLATAPVTAGSKILFLSY